MSEHYYTSQPTSKEQRRVIEHPYRGKTLRFSTDAGVFSNKQLDFGSRLLLDTIEFSPNLAVLDVGCGYGALGLNIAAHLSQGRVTMVDINERATNLAKENAKLNMLSNIEVLKSDRYEAVQGRAFDMIVTNPPIRAGKAIVHQIFSEAVDHLEIGGTLWIVIQKKQGAPSAKKKLEELFSHVEEKGKSKGYYVFSAQK